MATLDELLDRVHEIDAEIANLKKQRRKLWATQVDPLLVQAEDERRAHPTPDAEPQTVG